MVFTSVGKEQLAKALAGESFTSPAYIAWGTDSTAETENDTALGSESVRNAISSTERNNLTVEFESTLGTTQANGDTISEVGLFDASSGGNMFARNTISGISKNNTFEIQTTARVRVL